MKKSLQRTLFLTIVSGLLLVSCDLTDRGNTTDSQPPLEGTKWTLEAFEPEPGDPIEVENTSQVNYQIAFSSDSVFYATSGNTCDGFYESFTEGIINIKIIGCTRGRYTWSVQYEGALYFSYKYEISNEKLYLFHEDTPGTDLTEGKLRMKQGLEFESGWLERADD